MSKLISDLPAASSVGATDLFEISQSAVSMSAAASLLVTKASLGTGVATALGVNGGSVGAFPKIIAQGTAVINPGAIASAGVSSVIDGGTASGVLTTDIVTWGFNADISAVTGYAPVTTGGLVIYAYPTGDHVNFKVGNPTASSVTPGSITLNWRVVR